MIEVEDFLRVEGAPVRLVERAEVPSAFLERLAACAPWLELLRAAPRGLGPRLGVLGSRPHGEIVFVGPVEGRVAEALVVLLRELAVGEVGYDTPATPQLLRGLRRNVALAAHVSPTCPFCPAVMAAVLRFALATPRISSAVSRADLAPPSGLRTVPTVTADGRPIARGAIGELELAERLLEHAASP